MKITNQTAAVVIVGFVGFIGLILGLAVFAKWSDGAIVGMATAFGAVLVNTVVGVRGLQRADTKLDTITRQTNGLSEAEREDIAQRAAASVLQQARRDAGWPS